MDLDLCTELWTKKKKNTAHIINRPNNLAGQQERHSGAKAVQHLQLSTFEKLDLFIYYWSLLQQTAIVNLWNTGFVHLLLITLKFWDKKNNNRALYGTWAIEVAVTLSEGGNHTAEITSGPEPIWEIIVIFFKVPNQSEKYYFI